MELFEMDSAAGNAKNHISFFRKITGRLCLFSIWQQNRQQTFFISGTSGAEIHESIHPLEKEAVNIKNHPNSFRNTNLHQHLQKSQVSDLVICGAMKPHVHDTTTRELTWIIRVFSFLMPALHVISFLMTKK